MGCILQMARKEFVQMFRDPRMFGIIFIAPIFQLFLFGYAITTDVKNIRMGVLDLDRSAASRELCRSLVQSGYFTRAEEIRSDVQISRALEAGRVDLVLVLPEDFARKLDRGETARVQVLADGAESNSAGIALGYLQKILTDFNGGLMKKRVNRSGARVRMDAPGGLPLTPEIRFFYNPALKSSFYMVPGVLAMILLVITMLLTSLAITREREIGTMEQLVVTPIKPWQIIAGKMVPFAMIGVVDVTLILVTAVGHFQLPMVGSVGLLYLATAFFLFTTLGMGLLISTVSGTQQQAIFVSLLVMMPAILLSGLMFPIANMPEPVQWLTYANPLRFFLVIVRGIVLKGNGMVVLAPQFFMLFCLGVVVFTLAVTRFHKTRA